MRRLVFILILSVSFCKARGQNIYHITGSVVDWQKQGIGDVMIDVLNGRDSSALYRGLRSAPDGKYDIVLARSGDYLLRFSKLGYTGKTIGPVKLDPSNQLLAVETLVLEVAIHQLTEVTVRAAKPLLERKLDKIIMNVEANVLSPSDNAVDVLKMGPGVTVDSRDQVKINGRKAMIMVNGRALTVSGESLRNYIRNLPANSLSQIEIISNPSARYDAGGDGAVINIIPKKITEEGYKGGITGIYNYSKLSEGYLSGNLSYKHNNVISGLTLSGGSEPEKSDMVTDRYFPLSGERLNISEVSLRRKKPIGAGATINVDLNKTGYIGGGVSYNTIRIDDELNSRTATNGNFSSSMIDLADRTNHRNSDFDINSYYHQGFHNDTSSLDIKLDYWMDRRKQNRSLNAVDQNGGTIDDILLSTGDRSVNYSVKGDFNHSFKNGSRISFGAKSSLTKIDYDIDYQRKIAFIPNLLPGSYDYRENINSLYADQQFQKFGTWSTELGLRLENTNTRSGSDLLNGPVIRNYWNLFPNLIIQKDFKGQFFNNINVSYSGRINRPRYENLNPTALYASSFVYTTGNPELKPATINQLEATLNFLQQYYLVFTYVTTHNAISNTLLTTNGVISNISFDNLNNTRSYAAALNFPLHFGSFRMNNSLQVNKSVQDPVNATSGVLSAKVNFAANTSLQYAFKNDYAARLSAFYTGPTINGQIAYGSRQNLSFKFSKTWKKLYTVGIRVDDPFYFNNETYTVNTAEQVTHYRNRWNSRIVGVNFTYNFNTGRAFRAKYQSKGNYEESSRRN